MGGALIPDVDDRRRGSQWLPIWVSGVARRNNPPSRSKNWGSGFCSSSSVQVIFFIFSWYDLFISTW